MTDQRRPFHPLARAMEWVAKITTVALEMVLPGIGGGYLDQRLGTNYWAMIGLVFGVVLGLWHLLQMTKAAPTGRKPDRSKGGGENSGSAGD